jgi:hypothetical protein
MEKEIDEAGEGDKWDGENNKRDVDEIKRMREEYIVSEHMDWVRNVVLMNVYFGSGKPQGVGISGREPDGQMREMQGSVYEQPKEEVDGSCHSKEGSK